jgi:hypothetical protein
VVKRNPRAVYCYIPTVAYVALRAPQENGEVTVDAFIFLITRIDFVQPLGVSWYPREAARVELSSD